MRRRQVVERRVVLERFAHREKGVVARALRNVGESWRHVVSGYLLTEPGDRAVVATKKSRKTEQQRRFSGSRPADQTDDLTAIHVEIHFAKRRDRGCATARAGQISLGETSDA